MPELKVWVLMLFVMALLVNGALLGTASAQIAPTAVAQKGEAVPPSTEKASETRATDAAAKQLLLLMDTDKNGKVSKQEWMSFMEKEFDRLDTNKDGELDVNELKKSQVRPAPFYKDIGK